MTLQDALESTFAGTEAVKFTSESPFSEVYSLPTIEELYQMNDLMRNLTTSIAQSVDVQPKPLALNINGAFSVIVYAGEKCEFRKYCSNKGCIVKFSKWGVKSFPFSCGLFYKTLDYKKVVKVEANQ